jgi:hypothetical protein
MGACLPKVANCLAYIPGTNLCASCADGYTQSQDWSACVPGGISYCLQYDCLGLCVRCHDDLPRLSINRDVCLVNIQYCLTYVNDQNLCKACFNGYHLTSDSKGCVPNIQYCVSYVPQQDPTDQVYCSQCQNNYQLSPNKTECWSVIPNCRTYVTLNKTCFQCNPGFKTTDDSYACLPIIENCLVYQAATGLTLRNKCQICRETFQVSNDRYSCTPFCPPDTKLCASLNKCVVTPFCCATDDGCGRCLTLKPGYAICPECEKVRPDPPIVPQQPRQLRQLHLHCTRGQVRKDRQMRQPELPIAQPKVQH